MVSKARIVVSPHWLCRHLLPVNTAQMAALRYLTFTKRSSIYWNIWIQTVLRIVELLDGARWAHSTPLVTLSAIIWLLKLLFELLQLLLADMIVGLRRQSGIIALNWRLFQRHISCSFSFNAFRWRTFTVLLVYGCVCSFCWPSLFACASFVYWWHVGEVGGASHLCLIVCSRLINGWKRRFRAYAILIRLVVSYLLISRIIWTPVLFAKSSHLLL